MIRTILVLTMLASTPAMAWTDAAGNWHQDQRQNQAQAQAQAQRQGQKQTQTAVGNGGTASAATGASTSSVTLSGVGGSSTPPGRAPDVVLPSIGAAGMDCPTVGFGAGGAGLGGGGGIGPSWLSSDCNHRKITEIVLQLWGQDAARDYAIANLPGVREAVAAKPPVVEPARAQYRFPAWCRSHPDRAHPGGVWLWDLAECRP